MAVWNPNFGLVVPPSFPPIDFGVSVEPDVEGEPSVEIQDMQDFGRGSKWCARGQVYNPLLRICQAYQHATEQLKQE